MEELYILDSLYRNTEVVDSYESLIWTERFSQYGDFELLAPSTNKNRKLFPEGISVAKKSSNRVMVVDTVDDTTDEEGKKLLKIVGKSIEHILESRIARGSLSDLETEPKWVITDYPADIARKIYHDICVTGILDPGDIISNVSEGSSIFPTDTIAEPPDIVTYEIEPTTVYKAIKDLCDIYDMGFRMVRDIYTNQLYFDIYMGSDRTTSQSTLPSVVFSPKLENLQKTTEFVSSSSYKNVAYVFSPVGSEIVYPLDIDPTISGFERKVLLIKADDITDEDPGVASAKMIQRGKDELAKHRKFYGFDGELNQFSSYKYGVDFNLGDLVEMRNSDGVTNNMQVVEQIFVSDREGQRSYPTLALNKFITPGSWLSWDYNQVWEDLGPTEYWEDA